MSNGNLRNKNLSGESDRGQGGKISEPVQQLLSSIYGDNAPKELDIAVQQLKKIIDKNDGSKALEQLKAKMTASTENIGNKQEAECIYHPLSPQMQERIASLETQVKLLKQKKEKMSGVLVKLIGRYRLLREDNSDLASQLLSFKESRVKQENGSQIPAGFSTDNGVYSDSDIPPTPCQSFASGLAPQQGSNNLQQQISFGDNKGRLLQKLQTVAIKQGVPLTPHPYLAAVTQPPDSKEHILDDLKQQIEKVQEQKNQQSQVVEEQKKIQEQLEKQVELENQNLKVELEESEQEEDNDDEALDINEEDEDDEQLNARLASLPSVGGNYGSEELQLYEEALTESRTLIIQLENQLMETQRREQQMMQVREHLEQILQETQSSNVEVEEELIAAEKKLQYEKDRAEELENELQTLTSDHATARQELYNEIKQLKFELGKNLKTSLQEGIDLEFEEFVDVAEYVEDEEQDEGKPPNTSASAGKKTRVFNKLISYWQTRSTGSFVTRMKSIKVADSPAPSSELPKNNENSNKQSEDQTSQKGSKLEQQVLNPSQSLREKIEQAYDGTMQ